MENLQASRAKTMFEEARLSLVDQSLREIAPVPGAIVELGVALGGLTGYLSLSAPERQIFGFDRFEGGLSEPIGEDKPSHFEEGMMAERLEDVRAFLDSVGAVNATLIRGDVRETLPGRKLDVALCIVDLNLYLPTQVALDWCRAVMVKGGIVLVDDIAFPGVRSAVQRFGMPFEEVGYMARFRF